MGVEGEGTGARLDGLFANCQSGDAPLLVIEAAAPAVAAMEALSIGPLAAAATLGGPHRRGHDATWAARAEDAAADLSTHLARLHAADTEWLPLPAASSHWAIRNDPPFHTFQWQAPRACPQDLTREEIPR